MTLLANNDIVPVLTFHSVGMNEPSWTWSQLSERAEAATRRAASTTPSTPRTSSRERFLSSSTSRLPLSSKQCSVFRAARPVCLGASEPAGSGSSVPTVSRCR